MIFFVEKLYIVNVKRPEGCGVIGATLAVGSLLPLVLLCRYGKGRCGSSNPQINYDKHTYNKGDTGPDKY